MLRVLGVQKSLIQGRHRHQCEPQKRDRKHMFTGSLDQDVFLVKSGSGHRTRPWQQSKAKNFIIKCKYRPG